MDRKETLKPVLKELGENGLTHNDIKELSSTFYNHDIPDYHVLILNLDDCRNMKIDNDMTDRFLNARDKILGRRSNVPKKNDLQNSGEKKCCDKIVVIGNPGSGKSTVLNIMAGKKFFESGLSIGYGLTDDLDVKIDKNGTEFHDTPGIADDMHREKAGEALTKVFKAGGRIKIIFFVMQEDGRLRMEDAATMKLILDSVHEIKKNFGIIVNKVPDSLFDKFMEKEQSEAFREKLFYGIKDEYKHSQILFVKRNDQLDFADNEVINPTDLEVGFGGFRKDLSTFINSEVPCADIPQGLVKQIPVDRFENVLKQVARIEAEINLNNERNKNEKENLVKKLKEVKSGKTVDAVHL